MESGAIVAMSAEPAPAPAVLASPTGGAGAPLRPPWVDTGTLLGLDVGGTLAKLVLFVPDDKGNLLKEVAEHFATVGAPQYDN